MNFNDPAVQDSVKIVEEYISRSDWRVRENSNVNYSVQGLNFYVSGKISARYWLSKVYPREAAIAHNEGDFHIHNLSLLGAYCVGWDIEDLLRVGFRGAPGKIVCRPPKHFSSALGQLVNFLFTLQGETAGAQAVSDWDVYLAPFIAYDGLSYEEVKQKVQEFIYQLNVATRVGFQTPFTNITVDLAPPPYLEERPVIIGGKEQRDTYADFIDEIEMINLAFCEVMCEGDAVHQPFSFPIPTYNISPDFPWETDVAYKIFEMAGKYGYPYFANFINSDLRPEDVRSMCCRLRLDTRELRRRGGGLFGANPLTGSIGVVTINMPRIGYLSKDDDEFFERLEKLMEIAKEALEAKRAFIERYIKLGLYPYCKFYLRNVYAAFGEYWANHFSTIGLIGMNEALLNFMGVGIWDQEAKKFAERVLDFMLDKLREFQEETGHYFNLEATPAEGTSYRLAKIDKKKFPDIIVANEERVRKYGAPPFYTNSTWLPVDYTDDLWELLDHQESLQRRYTGGTVVHIWLGEAVVDPEALMRLTKKIFTRYRIPYISYTPTFSICPIHGYIPGAHKYCPYEHTPEQLKELGLIGG